MKSLEIPRTPSGADAPVELGRAKTRLRETRERKQEIMETLYLLGEREISLALDLSAYCATRYQLRRQAFTDVEGEDARLREADRVDELTHWVNEGDDERRAGLVEHERTPALIRDDLLAVSRDFFEYANKDAESADARPDAWRRDYEQLINDLYEWARSVAALDANASPFEQRRAERECARLEGAYTSPANLQNLLKKKRLELVRRVQRSSSITEDDWTKYLAQET